MRRNTNIFKVLLIMSFTISFMKCKCSLDESYSIYIDNKSEITISSYFALGGEGGIAYPDTSLSFDYKLIGYDTKPEGRAYRSLHTFTYEEWFKRLPQDTFSIFIFSEEVLENNSWSVIQANYNILKRYDLSLEDFKKLSNKNGIPIIPYPPTEDMRHMKMFPPY